MWICHWENNTFEFQQSQVSNHTVSSSINIISIHINLHISTINIDKANSEHESTDWFKGKFTGKPHI